MKNFITKFKHLGYILFWIILWHILAKMINREIYLPTPFNTIIALKKLMITTDFAISILNTLLRVFIGILISFILGITLGFFSAFNTLFKDMINPLVIVIRSTPVMAVIIIFLSWFKSYYVPIIICFLMCFPIIWTSVIEGVYNVDKNLLKMAKVYNVNKYNIFKKIYVPSIIPYITSSIIATLGLGWKVSVAAEVICQPKYGIGTRLYESKIYMESEELFAWTIVVIVLSFLFEYVFKYIIKIKLKRKYI